MSEAAAVDRTRWNINDSATGSSYLPSVQPNRAAFITGNGMPNARQPAAVARALGFPKGGFRNAIKDDAAEPLPSVAQVAARA
mmetsp:Transcript_42385/g.84939  ORF Transcript_42385/g.84939 Transcript_42385/m.84939 type:complete len:83 (+) Transcript_42385:3-251(+)